MTSPVGPGVRRYPIRLGWKSRVVLLLFGVRDANAYVDLGDDELDAHFGFFRFQTPTSNLASWSIEGPWRWITAIGVRMSATHRDDLSFGGTHLGGVRLDLRQAVHRFGARISTLYVTIDDLEGFAEDLATRGLPGSDARKPVRSAA